MTARSPGGQRAALAVPADISAALNELGIDHVIRGDEAIALCPSPAHADRTPNWSCNLLNGQNHCFSCGFGGSFVRLVSVVRRTSRDEAQLWVRAHRVMYPESRRDYQVASGAGVRESALWNCGPPPDDALARRKISREAASQLEILWDGKGWVFPIRTGGQLIGWQIKRDKYVRNRPPSLDKRRALFGDALTRFTGTEGPVIVVESPLNAGRFLTAGFPRVVATYGIEFTDEQMSEVQQLGTGIIFAQDNDNAGQRKIARWLHAHPLERQFCKVFDYGNVFQDEYSHMYVHPAGDGRDPGDLDDHEIHQGIEWATPGRRTIFEEFPEWR